MLESGFRSPVIHLCNTNRSLPIFSSFAKDERGLTGRGDAAEDGQGIQLDLFSGAGCGCSVVAVSSGSAYTLDDWEEEGVAVEGGSGGLSMVLLSTCWWLCGSCV